MLHLCRCPARRQVLGDLPLFGGKQRSSPGRRWGSCRTAWTWRWGCCSEPDLPESILMALYIHPCFPQAYKPQRLLLRCCCIGAPSSADIISYSAGQIHGYGGSQFRRLNFQMLACFPECKAILHYIWKMRLKLIFGVFFFVLCWYHWDAKGNSLLYLCL